MAKEIGNYLDEIVSESGEPHDWETANHMVQQACLQLGRDRQELYGHGNIEKFGLHGVVIRATDKLERLHTMVWAGKDHLQEGIEDSAGDLANYGVYGVMLCRGWWNLPLKESS